MIILLLLSSLSFAGTVPAFPAAPVLAAPVLAAPVLAAQAAAVQAAASPAASAPDDPALDAKIAAAGSDVAKLLAVAAACTAPAQDEAARKIYTKVLTLDANNEAAHKGLHHQFYDGKWFESFAELTKYKRDEDSRMKAKGLARFKDEWVPEADVPFLNMGWIKDDSGVWMSPLDAAQAVHDAKWQKAGYEFRADDDSWVAPDEKEHWTPNEWKCGDEWLDTAKANTFHSEIGKWWQVVGDHFTVWTTCDWDGGNLARWHAEKVYPELVRLFGVEPDRQPHFIVLNSLAQYNQAAGGNPPSIPESTGASSLYGAYFADAYFDTSVTPRQFIGAGVSFWDRTNDKLKVWGPYFLRWAAAQSFVDAIDPSWTAIGDMVSSGQATGAAPDANAFWAEKKIPRWLRYGAASYAERFMRNPEAAEGTDPWNMRAFAFSDLKKAGGLRKLDDVFAFKIDVQNADDATRLYHEAGLLVAFLLDGAEGNKPLANSHAAFKDALKTGTREDVNAAVDLLQKSLAKSDADIRKFAGL